MTDITAPLSTSTASVITTSSNGIVIDYSSYFERIASSLETIAAATTITAIISNSLAAIATTNTFIAASLDIIANASTASQASLAAIATTDTFIAASLDSIAITNAAIESTNTTIATLLATIANASTSTSASLGELSASHATVALSNVVTGVTHVTNMLAGINGNGVNPVVTPDGITIPGVSKELGSSLSSYPSITTVFTATFVANVGGLLGNILYVSTVTDGALHKGMNIRILLPNPLTYHISTTSPALYVLSNTIIGRSTQNQSANGAGIYLLQYPTLHRDTAAGPGYNGVGVLNSTTVILSTSSSLLSGLTNLLSKIL